MIYLTMVIAPVFGAMVWMALWDARGERELSLAERRNPFLARLRSRLHIGAAESAPVVIEDRVGLDKAA
jgi:hypothetical protein